MAKAKHRKKKVQKTTLMKSVFLYGQPNADKLKKLIALQTEYTNAINDFITLLSKDNTYLLEILKNDKKSSVLRALEKEHRNEKLKSALSQTAFDEAVMLLHNRATNIKNEIYGIDETMFSSSLVAFCYAVFDKSREEFVQTLTEIRNSYKDKSKIEFYDSMLNCLNSLSDDEFIHHKQMIQELYVTLNITYKIPHVEKAHVRLDSRTHTLAEAKDIQSSHVISIIDIDGGVRFDVPINTSGNSLRRLKQYKHANTIHYTITDNNLLKVAVAFEKNVRLNESDNYEGVDIGICDAIHTSNGMRIGSFGEIINFYQDTINKDLANLNNLRNKKRKLENYLESHQLPAIVCDSIKKKIENIDKNINENKISKKNLNRYYHNLNKEIGKTIKSYLANIDKDTTTVLELLDIKEFNKSRHCNQMLSMFARGLLQKKLMESLNWYGYNFVEVEPAYTSQGCPHCHNLNKANRNGKVFKCTECGFEDDTDHVGSLNIKARATDAEVLSICDVHKYNKTKCHAALVELYNKRHEEYKKSRVCFDFK